MEREPPRPSPRTGERGPAQPELCASVSPVAPPALDSRDAAPVSMPAPAGTGTGTGEAAARSEEALNEVASALWPEPVPAVRLVRTEAHFCVIAPSPVAGAAPAPEAGAVHVERECPVCMTAPESDLFARTGCCNQLICDPCVARMYLTTVAGAVGPLASFDGEEPPTSVDAMLCPCARARSRRNLPAASRQCSRAAPRYSAGTAAPGWTPTCPWPTQTARATLSTAACPPSLPFRIRDTWRGRGAAGAPLSGLGGLSAQAVPQGVSTRLAGGLSGTRCMIML